MSSHLSVHKFFFLQNVSNLAYIETLDNACIHVLPNFIALNFLANFLLPQNIYKTYIMLKWFVSLHSVNVIFDYKKLIMPKKQKLVNNQKLHIKLL